MFDNDIWPWVPGDVVSSSRRWPWRHLRKVAPRSDRGQPCCPVHSQPRPHLLRRLRVKQTTASRNPAMIPVHSAYNTNPFTRACATEQAIEWPVADKLAHLVTRVKYPASPERPPETVPGSHCTFLRSNFASSLRCGD